jgi:NADPH:quinone reductase-like Zn-dependent oxidoreductase
VSLYDSVKRVGAGTTLIVNGAAGAVGSAAVQLARTRGARVIGTASTANHSYLRSLGAEPTTYGEDLAERVRELAQTFPLEQIGEAHRSSETGHVRGKLVLLIG